MINGKQQEAVLVKIQRDPVAGVWFGEGINIKGLLAEAETMDELHELICELIPVAIEMNGPPEPYDVREEVSKPTTTATWWTLPTSFSSISQPSQYQHSEI